MPGSIIVTTAARDAAVKYIQENAYKFRLGEGGFVKSPLISEVVDASASGTESVYDYTIAGGEFSIVSKSATNDTFYILGDHVALFAVGAQIHVYESPGDDGYYTVVSAVFDSTNTVITVEEDVSIIVVGGQLSVDRFPICKGPNITNHHHPLRVIEYTPGMTVVQEVVDTTGTGDLTDPVGLGVGTVNYKTGVVHVDFESAVAAGNSVVIEFKYGNTPSTPDSGLATLESQADTEGPGGASSFYTFEKLLQAGDIVYQGEGTGRIRCTLFLDQPEGLADGMTYGGVPYYFEGGIFDIDDAMLCHFTFVKERKSGAVTLEHTVDFVM